MAEIHWIILGELFLPALCPDASKSVSSGKPCILHLFPPYHCSYSIKNSLYYFNSFLLTFRLALPWIPFGIIFFKPEWFLSKPSLNNIALFCQITDTQNGSRRSNQRCFGSAWVAQGVEHFTWGMISRLLRSSLAVLGVEPACDSLSPSFSAPPLLAYTLSLKRNKNKHKKYSRNVFGRKDL